MKEERVGRRERRRKMNLRWMEAVLPLGIIAGMLCVMGNAQYYIHRAAHGRVISLFFFLLFLLSINFWIGSFSVMLNSFSLSTSETICGTLRWNEGTRSFMNKPPPPINAVSFALVFLF